MGLTPLDGIDVPEWWCLTALKRGSVHNEVNTGLDLVKNVIQAHGADAAGAIVIRKQLRRDKVLAFLAGQPACLVAMEACAGRITGRARSTSSGTPFV